MSAIRHTTTTRRRVLELREAGWSITRIAQILSDEGTPLSQNTVWCYVNEEAAERQRLHRRHRNRAERAARARFAWPGARRSEAWLVGRMRHLRDAGLSYNAIATLARVDHDRDLSAGQVRRLVGEAP